MALHQQPRVRLTVAALLLVTSGCATGYGAKGLTGGYSDERIDDTHYVVRFNGNGHASKDRVWNFWFYRCAELTKEKGFAYFDLETAGAGRQSRREEPAGIIQPATYHPAEDEPIVIPAYTYTVTTWNSSAVIALYASIPAGKLVMSAARVLELLGPYVKANGYGTAPERKVLFRGALTRLGANQEPERLYPDGLAIGYFNMGRVLESLPDVKAARERVKASTQRKQQAFDAAKVELDRLRKSYAVETNLARKVALDSRIATAKADLQKLYDRLRAEVQAEKQQAMQAITARVQPVVERVRIAQHLDAVTEQDAGALWDVDVTAEVVRQYLEAYPPGPTHT